jgi:hypothetical protein
MELVVELVLGTIKSVVWGIVLLLVAFFILPPYVINGLLKKIRPDLISRDLILSRVKLVFDYLFNYKEVIVSGGSDARQKQVEQEIADLMREKRLLEGNLFS